MRFRVICVSLLSFMLVILSNSSYGSANTGSQTPNLEAYQLNNHVKLEWAVEMLDEDVLYETGFEEGDELPNLDYSNSHLHLDENRWYGGQDFTTSDKHTGKRSLIVIDSYTNSNVYQIQLDNSYKFSSYSRATFIDNRYYMPNGTDLSLSFVAKTTGTGKVKFLGSGGSADYGQRLSITFLEDVKVGDRTAKVSNPQYFKNYVDKGTKYYLANMKGAYTGYLTVTKVDMTTSTITLNNSFRGEFKKGDKVLRHNYRSPVDFGEREVKSGQGWQLFNVNTKVLDFADYNTALKGFMLTINTTTRDTVYLDDIKVGYATETQLFRGSEKIYEGKLSDFEDTQASDKAKPNKVVDYSVSTASGKQYLNIVEPKDNGTPYKYTVKAISNDGSGVYSSEEKTVNVTSGIKGYSYVIDKKPSTNPSGTVNSTDGKIELSKDVYKDYYLHIQSIDHAGNKSEISHIKLDKVKDITPPTVKLTQTPTDWTNKNVTINVDATDSQSGVKKIMYIGENMVRNGDFAKGLDEWTVDRPDPTVVGGGDIAIRNGHLYLGDNRTKQNKAVQENAFKDSPLGSEFYAVVDAKGTGVLNARYARQSGSPHQTDYQKNINHPNEFKRYSFGITRFENSKDDFVIERRSQDGWIEAKVVEVYAQKEVTDNKLVVTENGTYKFVVEDNEGNITTESITISNIDKEAPSVTITPNTTETTHENVTLTINANDSLSGVKSITYIGENMVKNGDFSEVSKYWSKQNYYGTWEVVDGVLSLSDNTVSINKAYQANAFKGTTEGSSYFAEIEARGTGELNARYGVSGGDRQVNHSKQIDNSNWETYTYIMERYSYSNDNFIIERVGTGSIDIKNINLYAQKEITDNKLVVTQNGTYTFVVEDHAGNISTKSFTVNNIDKTISFKKPSVGTFKDVTLQDQATTVATDVSPIVVQDWRDSNNEWRLNVSATPLKGLLHTLPKGTIKLKEISRINQVKGSGTLPTKGYSGNKVIDDGTINIVESVNARGEYEITFPTDALEIVVDPTTSKIGKYESTITWDLIHAP